jgi:hypothetical protein
LVFSVFDFVNNISIKHCFTNVNIDLNLFLQEIPLLGVNLQQGFVKLFKVKLMLAQVAMLFSSSWRTVCTPRLPFLRKFEIF